MIGLFHSFQTNTVWLNPVAQLAGPGVDTPEEAALIFSGPQFFIALLSGLILAFGFHLLLTNLSVAAGISYLGHSTSSGSKSSSGKSRKISTAFGLWTLITVTLALFCACLLAVKLSLYNSALMGAITGLVIWGLYFCLLFWVSSTTVGSLIGSVVKTATSSFQSLVSAATAALGATTASQQVVKTAEATASAVRKEITSAWNGEDVKETLRDYLMTLRSPSLDIEELESEFERLVRESNITNLADQETLGQLDRATFEKLVSSRTDLSRRDAERIADRLYRSWQRAVGRAPDRDPMMELVDYLRTAKPDELISERLGDRLDEFLAEYRQQRRSQQSGFLTRGLNMLLSVILGRTDLSELDVETITQRLKELQHHLGGQIESLAPGAEKPYNVVKADVENYLLHAYPWQLQPHRMKLEFWDVLYDPQADPGILRQNLMALNRSYFADVLASRGLLTQAEISRVSTQLDDVRQRVQAEVEERYRIEAAKALQNQLYTFLRQVPKDELLSDKGMRDFRSLIEDPYAKPEELRDRFSPFGYESFLQTLLTRGDLSETEAQTVASGLENTMNAVRADAEGMQSSAQARIENQWQALQHYLRNTGREELDPDSIKADVRALLQEPDVGIHRVRQRMATFDRDTLVQLLSQRPDLSETEVQRTLDQVEGAWYQAISAPAALTSQARAKYDEATSALENYLLQTGKPELNPTGIKRDLELLLNHPKIGIQAMRQRLSEVDRDTLVQLLSQRDDLTEEEVNQIIDDILATLQDVLHLPRRLARRAQARVMSFESALEDYLRNTDRAELNPEGIKRDLQMLLNDPRLGSDRLQTRLSKIDRNTIVALLAQREDISLADAESAVDQVLAVRDQIVAQLRQVQENIKAVVRGILARIRSYLNSLDRPELNYYGIKRDLQQVLDDPQTGFEALRVRLGQIDRDTLVAILSSHDAISEADANQLIGQVEHVRDATLHKAQQLEHAVEERLAEVRHQTQEQLEETRKTAAAAAWWIFGTATVSAIASAFAGSLAVIG